MEIKMKKNNEVEIEAAVFRKMVKHFQDHPEVQNIDVMNIAGFCRNCLSRWYSEAAQEDGVNITKDKAREIVYGMPHVVWKEKYQIESSEDQKNKFQTSIIKDH